MRSRLISAKPTKSTWSRCISSAYSLKSPPLVPRFKPHGLPKYIRKTVSGLLVGGGVPMNLFLARARSENVSALKRKSVNLGRCDSWLVGFIRHAGKGGIHARIRPCRSGFTWLYIHLVGIVAAILGRLSHQAV